MRRRGRTGREGRLAELLTDLAAFGLGGVVVAWCLLTAWVLGTLSLFDFDTRGYAALFLLAAGLVALWSHLRAR